ncbi:BA75_03359T0 [Komagataella pastoris]|uniref:BA75_03359T0 n=1 Tax=Komagataella pastoris TaxID=4922 RepID=A0A1B2JF30_PICPA|nr:BA75_03359T0 [Komagataella pastoris]
MNLKAPLVKSQGFASSPIFLLLDSVNSTCLLTRGSYRTWLMGPVCLGLRRVLVYPVCAVDSNLITTFRALVSTQVNIPLLIIQIILLTCHQKRTKSGKDELEFSIIT